MIRRLWTALLIPALFSGLTSAVRASDPQPEPKSVPALELECSMGSSASCDELSSRFDAGRGVKQDPVQSARYKLRACEAGSARACGVYASRIHFGRPGYPRNDPALVARYSYKGCKLGDGPTCGAAAAIANTSNHYTPQARAEIYQEVCRIGKPEDCERAAYAEGQRGNWKNAADLSRRACARGMKNSCQNAAAYTARYENSIRARNVQTAPSPPPSPRRVDATITEDMYQPDRGRRSNYRDQSRSGYESCTKSNGTRGKRYWYYGFDNKRNYGPCL